MRSITKNANFYFLILTFTLLLFSQNGFAQTCSPAPVGLVSWWQGENNALDSRSRNNGTLQNGATFAAGNVGQAFELDGVNDFVSAPDSPSLRPTNLTIEGWFRFDSVTGSAKTLIDKTVGSSDSYVAFYLPSSQQLGFATGSVVGLNGGLLFNFVPTLGQWNHLAFTFDDATKTQTIYINGTLSASNTVSNSIGYDSNVVKIGSATGLFFDGGIDELSIYNRALQTNEIQAIFNAGQTGKCKPTATVAPSGQVGWWSGDGNANDIAGTNNGTLQNNATHTIGKVGQAFSFNSLDALLATPNSTLNDAFPTISIEGWVNPATHGTDGTGTFGKTIVSNTNGDGFALRLLNGVIQSDLRLTGGDARTTFGTALPLNAWSHVALTYDGTNVRAFLNGVQVGSNFPASGTVKNTANSGICLFIGGDPSPACTADTGFGFNGGIDELSIYNRAITSDEITSIFNAGIAGKLKDNTTPIGSNVSVIAKSDGTVTFPTVTTAGITQQIPLDLSTLPSLPFGSFTGLAYDIATSSSFTGNPTVCFNLPSFTPAQFANLRVLHLEAGAWVMQTANSNTFPTLCSAPLPSLSPFAIIQLAPTAASVSVSGRVRSANGHGVRNVRLTLTAPDGTIRTARTSTFGYYAFLGVEVGHTYVLEITSSKRYTFANPTRVFGLQDTLTDIDFTAESP